MVLTRRVNRHSVTFTSAWDLLARHFQNRRAIIKVQLDKLYALSSLTSSSADSLRKLLATTTETKLTLNSLGMAANIGDCLLVHHVWRNLDDKIHEAWETSLEQSPDYPLLDRLEKLIVDRQ